MILTCPNCTSQFKVNAALIPAEGRKVRCATCKHEWMAYSEDRVGELTPPPPAPDPDAPMDAVEEIKRLIAFPDPQPSWEEEAQAEIEAALPVAEPEADEADEPPLDEAELEPLDETVDEPADEAEEEPDQDESIFEAELENEDNALESETEEELEEDLAKEPEEEPELIASISPAKDMPFEAKETLSPEPQAAQKAKLLPLLLLASVLFIALLITSFMAFRSSLQPSFAGLYALFGVHPTDGVSLTDVTVRERPARSKARFIIEGFMVNGAQAPRYVPMLRVAVIGKNGEVLQSHDYSDEAQTVLQPGERYAFKASNLEVDSKDAVAWFVLDIGNEGDLKLRSPTDAMPQVQLGEPEPQQPQEPAHE